MLQHAGVCDDPKEFQNELRQCLSALCGEGGEGVREQGAAGRNYRMINEL